MSETKDISKKRLSAFLAARLRAKRTDENHSPHASSESRATTSTRSEEKPASVTETRSR
jgi:hypothetical protein